MPESFDVIIIGAGHNGLVAAAYLARAGRRVLVLESRELVGGCAVTEEIWPGYRVSTASYLSSLMQEKVVRELELAKFGYAVDAKDPAFFSPFPDGTHLFMWQDRGKTLEEIAKFSQARRRSVSEIRSASGTPGDGRRIAAADHSSPFSAALRAICRII